jgi:transcriptional regulator with XRE-family HTH domain
MSVEWFGARLRELREQRGLTQQELAERIGTTVRNISRLETGVQEATWPTVVALAKVFGVSCDAFLQKPAATVEPKRGRPHGRPRTTG